MNYGIIKNIGNGQVDIQLTGSSMVVRNVEISAQVNWNMLTVGTRVLVDTVNDKPIVLHTVMDVPQIYTTEEQVYIGSSAYTPEGALLADGSVSLVGNLYVAPGIKIDGYDISVLGQTIDNLQAVDSVARTGYTVMTHASHLVEAITATAVQVKIRHDIFANKELLTVSNANGEIENMKVVGAAIPIVDNRGVPCYLYTVVRRISTSPANLITGWAANTLINGLTLDGYISFDARSNRPATPSMRFVLHTDIDANTTEHIVRVGSLNNILDYTNEDYGFAIGRLTTGDKYLAYSYAANRFRIRGADFSGEDETGAEVFRIWGTAENERVPGDFRFGPVLGGHQEWSSESQRLSIFNGANEVIYFSPTESRFRNMVWAGSEAGPQIGIGELEGEGIIVARNAFDVAQFVVRTQDDGVYVFAGNPKPRGNWMEFDNGLTGLTVDGTVRARALEIIGQATVGSDTSEIIIRDPTDPRRYGHIKPHYLAGYSVDGLDTQYLSTLLAWAPATLEVAPGSGQFHTWLAGESFFGDWRYRHFRIERAGRVGLFNGEDPKAYMTALGDLELDGSLTSANGRFRVDTEGVSFTENAGTYWKVKPQASYFMELASDQGTTYNTLRVNEASGIAGYFSGGYIGVYGRSVTEEIGIMGFSGTLGSPTIPPIDEVDPDMTDGIETLVSGTSVYGLTYGGTAGRFVASGGGRGVVGLSDDATLAGVVAKNTGSGPSLTVESSYLYMSDQYIKALKDPSAAQDAATKAYVDLGYQPEKTPASASATGVKGEVCFDGSYLYVCTATNTWKRVAISTW